MINYFCYVIFFFMQSKNSPVCRKKTHSVKHFNSIGYVVYWFVPAIIVEKATEDLFKFIYLVLAWIIQVPAFSFSYNIILSRLLNLVVLFSRGHQHLFLTHFRFYILFFVCVLLSVGVPMFRRTEAAGQRCSL